MPLWQAGSTWVAQRRRGVKAVVISLNYHKSDSDFLCEAVVLNVTYLMRIIIITYGAGTTRVIWQDFVVFDFMPVQIGR